MKPIFIFWCTLPGGRQNSISADNLYDAPRRARALGAEKLFVKNMANGKTAEMPF